MKLAHAMAKQAQSDYRVFEHLHRLEGVEPCHPLHYLQMACEKVAKSLAGITRRRHDVFRRFVQDVASRDLSLMMRCGFRTKDQYVSHLRSVAHFALAVDQLSPAVEPPVRNVEYPYEASATGPGEHIAPCDAGFADVPLNSTQAVRFLRFLERCLEHASS